MIQQIGTRGIMAAILIQISFFFATRARLLKSETAYSPNRFRSRASCASTRDREAGSPVGFASAFATSGLRVAGVPAGFTVVLPEPP